MIAGGCHCGAVRYTIARDDLPHCYACHCHICHARVYNTSSAHADIAVVQAGTLDRSEEVACRAHIFTAYRQRWVTIADDRPSWPEAPPPDAFIAAMTAPRMP